jgi:hypothetical protein
MCDREKQCAIRIHNKNKRKKRKREDEEESQRRRKVDTTEKDKKYRWPSENLLVLRVVRYNAD